jgi:hypothetical protein
MVHLFKVSGTSFWTLARKNLLNLHNSKVPNYLLSKEEKSILKELLETKKIIMDHI